MKAIQNIVLGLLIGLLLGLWVGVNIGKEQPVFSNPFAERTFRDRVKEKADEIYEDTKQAIDDGLKQ